MSINEQIKQIEIELRKIINEIEPSLNPNEKNPIGLDRYTELVHKYSELINEKEELMNHENHN